MAPASRGRKPKKKQKKTGKTVKIVRPTPAQPTTPPRRATFLFPGAPPEQFRRWWRPSIEGILADAHQLTGTAGPRELEQAVAELLGASLHRALETETAGFALVDWLATLIDAAGTAAKAAQDPDGLRYLLHGIAAIAPHPLARTAATWFGRLGGPRAGEAEWLATTGAVAPASDVRLLCDGYGTRFGVLIRCHRPGRDDGEVFALDIDACTPIIRPVDADVYDTTDAAAQAWRDAVGPSAADTQPEPADPALLTEILPFPGSDLGVIGDESRRIMDNYFRMRRRCDDLRTVLAAAGRPLPPDTERRSWDLPADPHLDGFTTWYTGRHATPPDAQAARWLIEEWVVGTIRQNRLACPPHRTADVRKRIALEWNDDPTTHAAVALIPDWVRWCAEQTGLAPELAEHAHAYAAAPEPGHPDDQPAGAPGSEPPSGSSNEPST